MDPTDPPYSARKKKASLEEDGDMPTSLRLPRQLVARVDRLVGQIGDTRADVLRASIGQGVVGLEEQVAIGRAAIAKVALEAADDVFSQGARALGTPVIYELARAVEERNVALCVRGWRLALELLQPVIAEAKDEQVVVYEGEVIRRAVGTIGVVAGRPGWAMAAVRELIGEPRYRSILG